MANTVREMMEMLAAREDCCILDPGQHCGSCLIADARLWLDEHPNPALDPECRHILTYLADAIMRGDITPDTRGDILQCMVLIDSLIATYARVAAAIKRRLSD